MKKLILMVIAMGLLSSLFGCRQETSEVSAIYEVPEPRNLPEHTDEFLVINIDNSEFCGLRLGDCLDDIKSVFGEPLDLGDGDYCYLKKGISFSIGEGKLFCINAWFSKIRAEEPFKAHSNDFIPAKIKLSIGSQIIGGIGEGLSKEQIEKTVNLPFHFADYDSVGFAGLEYPLHQGADICFELKKESGLIGIWISN